MLLPCVGAVAQQRAVVVPALQLGRLWDVALVLQTAGCYSYLPVLLSQMYGLFLCDSIWPFLFELYHIRHVM